MKYWYKIFLLKHIFRFEYNKNYISKLSIKMFIKIDKKKNLNRKGLCLQTVMPFVFIFRFRLHVETRYNSVLLQSIFSKDFKQISGTSFWQNTDKQLLPTKPQIVMLSPPSNYPYLFGFFLSFDIFLGWFSSGLKFWPVFKKNHCIYFIN